MKINELFQELLISFTDKDIFTHGSVYNDEYNDTIKVSDQTKVNSLLKQIKKGNLEEIQNAIDLEYTTKNGVKTNGASILFKAILHFDKEVTYLPDDYNDTDFQPNLIKDTLLATQGWDQFINEDFINKVIKMHPTAYAQEIFVPVNLIQPQTKSMINSEVCHVDTIQEFASIVKQPKLNYKEMVENPPFYWESNPDKIENISKQVNQLIKDNSNAKASEIIPKIAKIIELSNLRNIENTLHGIDTHFDLAQKSYFEVRFPVQYPDTDIAKCINQKKAIQKNALQKNTSNNKSIEM